MKLIFKIIASISIIILSLSSISLADDHISKKEIIVILKQEITELGDYPKKRKFLQSSKDYIAILKEQKKEIKKRNKIEAARKELVKELEKLGEKPKSETKDIDTDEEIIALRKQLDEVKERIQKEKDEKKKAKEKKLAEEKKKADAKKKKADAEKKKEKLTQDRAEAIQDVKKEIIFLGETPLSEFEANNNDEYIAALNKQLEEVKALKLQEEKEIEQSIPDWFIMLPKADEKVMYVRGTAVVDTLQGSIDTATNAALRELGKKLETRLNSKIKETVRQAGVGEDIVTKSEMRRVSSFVIKEVTISGYEVAENKLVKLDNGKYRCFILLEYPIAKVYKTFIDKVEDSEGLKPTIQALKETKAFKELENFVAEFTGA